MLEFLLAPQNVPFAVALGLMLLIALFEGVGLLAGMSLTDALDSALPDLEGQLDLDSGEIVPTSALSRILSWLRVGRVPVLMLIVVFLTAFGSIGYVLQYFAVATLGAYLPALLVVLPAFAGALPAVRVSALGLEAVLPRDETSAVSATSFVGRMVTITLGNASHDLPAEARLTDQYGTAHYVRVVPERDHAPLPQGARALLVRREGSVFVAIASSDPLMND
ncbi:YqiJ family protein [Ectothiorhodospiraceae bacterium 2226]|nr:YqiJ family protein [Ectothiorhodospiraceae bacterium 2226]